MDQCTVLVVGASNNILAKMAYTSAVFTISSTGLIREIASEAKKIAKDIAKKQKV